jgi:hypothetical protein
MARARNIKPGFFSNDVLAELNPLARLLFAGLWTIADREGRLEDRPKKIKAMVLPYDDCDCNALLQSLHDHGFILRYVADGNRYIQIIKWHEHQNPHVKEADSSIPAPDKSSSSPAQEPDEQQPLPERAGLIPDSLNPITDSLNLIPLKPLVEQKPLDASQNQGEEVETIFAYWQKVMKSPKSVLDADRTKIIRKALKNYSPADICKAIRGCSKTPYNMGQNPQKTKYNGLSLILRSAEYIDKFIALDADPARAAVETMDEINARATAEFLGEGTADDGMTIEMEA